MTNVQCQSVNQLLFHLSLHQTLKVSWHMTQHHQTFKTKELCQLGIFIVFCLSKWHQQMCKVLYILWNDERFPCVNLFYHHLSKSRCNQFKPQDLHGLTSWKAQLLWNAEVFPGILMVKLIIYSWPEIFGISSSHHHPHHPHHCFWCCHPIMPIMPLLKLQASSCSQSSL